MSCCGVTIQAHRNADLRKTYQPNARYSFSGFTALMQIRDGSTVLLTISMAATANSSVFSIVGDSLVLTIEKEDLASLALSSDARILSYDIVVSQGGFDDWFLGGDFVLLALNDASVDGNSDVTVEIGGQQVDVTIMGGNIGAGASVLLADLNSAVEMTAMSADQAATSALQASEAAASAAAVTVNKVNKTGDTITGPTSLVGAFQFTDLGPVVPPDGVYMGSGGPSLSFQTLISSPSGAADRDNQRALLLVNGVSKDGGNSEEQLVCIQMDINTGYLDEFIPNNAYALGAEFVDTPGNNIYQVTTAGTSGATAPTGKGTGITNGTMVVKWINDAAIGAKLPLYIEATAGPNAGSVWGEVANLELKSGNKSKFACARETDLTNNTGIDSEFGGLNRYGHYIGIQGPNRSTAGQQISSANTSTWAAFWGSYYAGTKLAQNAVICVDASSAIGLGFGNGAGGAVTPTFTTATIRDRSISPTGLSLAGTYSSAQISLPAGGGAPAAISISGTKTLAAYLDASTAPKAITLQGANSIAAIEVSATTPASFSSTGTKTIGAFVDASTAPYGMNLGGTYSTAAIMSSGFSVFADGSVLAASLRFNPVPANFADDTAAAAGGILVGGVYRTGNVLKVRVT